MTEFPVALDPRSVIVTGVDTKIGRIDYLLPGVDRSGVPTMIADFTGVELGTGEPCVVTIIFEFPSVKDWVLSILSMLAQKGWWKP